MRVVDIEGTTPKEESYLTKTHWLLGKGEISSGMDIQQDRMTFPKLLFKYIAGGKEEGTAEKEVDRQHPTFRNVIAQHDDNNNIQPIFTLNIYLTITSFPLCSLAIIYFIPSNNNAFAMACLKASYRGYCSHENAAKTLPFPIGNHSVEFISSRCALHRLRRSILFPSIFSVF